MTQKKDPDAPTLTQKSVLAQAVFVAYRKGWNGKLGSEYAPTLPEGTFSRVGVPLGTREACERRGLVEAVPRSPSSTSYTWRLTKLGIEVGDAYYEKKHGETAKKAGRVVIDQEKARRKAHADRKKRAKHLFRGLHRERGAKGKRTIAAAIDESGEVRLNLDDLLVLGEEIEKLRQAAGRS
ncbi:MAG TPA: hypothetical protein VN903_03575 [Polyangia bacterium]|nr:hypothetical protein [Polyangia bacterium]